MNLLTSTKVESSSLGTTPVKVWAVNRARIGIQVHASSGNAANLLVYAQDSGGDAPVVTIANAMHELSPGQTLEGDERFNGSKDIYVAMVSGTGAFDAYEVVN